ncbi:lipoate--protein ligase family protein, partial [Anaerolinea sp.]|uniref:lipoate--protein ligase family protein n=1 Tax=Anaerolinea sp. TaxID=1872519 RepID=UPI002ACD8A13
MSNIWRLLISPPARGTWNMAVDETLMEFCSQGQSLPVLRLYAWDPPCLSLGQAQPVQDVDFSALAQNGWDLVRRPTGGRAILHTDELTYAVIAPSTHEIMSGGLMESYMRISRFLLRALEHLAVPAVSQKEYAMPADANPKGPVCFEVPSNYEITVRGKKLIGSAQFRRKDSVLQHGSLPLFGDLTRITQALNHSSEAQRRESAHRLSARATTLEQVLGRQVTWQEAADAFIQAFAETFDVAWEVRALSREEQERATQL